MDTKALAKSKRAHSQHHSKKSHSNQKTKPQSEGANVAGNRERPFGKEVRERIHESQSSSTLPSNWDRYGEEIQSGSVDVGVDNSNHDSDIVFPKSKGADYRHLVEEAQSRTQSYANLGTSPSLDDVLPGNFEWGLGSMVAVRGENILSWIGDDSFVVEEKNAAIPEASFLSLNLHAIAEQLAKVDLPERLFIERDVLPLELCGKEKKSRDEQYDKMPTYGCEDGEGAPSVGESFKMIDNTDEDTSDGSSGSDFLGPSSNINPVNFGPSQLGKSSQNNALDSTSKLGSNTIRTPDKKKVPTFEAATAEEELDMLLSSFSDETKEIDFPTSRTGELSQLPSKGPVSTMARSNLDDGLDDLLDETYNILTQRKNAVEIYVHSSPSASKTKSEEVDDFDSWLDTL